MGSPPESAAPCRQVYVLTVWRATSATPWRAALRPTGSQERIGFADLETLALFLLGLDDNGRDGRRRETSDGS